MYKKLFELNKSDQINYLKNKKLATQIVGDMLEVEGDISDVDILEGNHEYFLVVTFNKNNLFDENILIMYDDNYEPIGKLAYSCNEKDAKISFDYFFVRKDLRGQHLGQTMMSLFIEKMEDKFGEDLEVFTNPYSFDVSFGGIKGYDYESQMHQYRLEQFYINNGFLLTEEPKKHAFGEEEYNEDAYKLTPMPLEEDPLDYVKPHTKSFGQYNSL